MRKVRRGSCSFATGIELWSIVCDICENPMEEVSKKGRHVAEFVACGAETRTAVSNGWLVAGDFAICPKCLESIGGSES